MADWYFHERGIRDQVQLTYVTPLDGAFTKPVASARLAGMLAEKAIDLVTEFNTGEIDGADGRLTSYDGRVVDFDLAVVVPLHGGAPYVERSAGLGDDLNFVPTDEHTLQSKAAPNVFVIGDAATSRPPKPDPSPTSKVRFWLRMFVAIWPEKHSIRALTGTQTVSSRPGSTKPC